MLSIRINVIATFGELRNLKSYGEDMFLVEM
jgi:hypothetical protein